MKNKPDYLIVCKNEKFMLPVYKCALTKSNRSLKFLQKRYLGALVLSKNGDTKTIAQIEQTENSLLVSLAVLFGLKYVTIDTTLVVDSSSFSDVLKTIIDIAIAGDSYSVWAQFYDSKKELSDSLAKCNSVSEVFEALHLKGEGDTSEILV